MIKEKSSHSPVLGWTLFIGVISLWLISWYLISTTLSETTRGIFGDMFGAVNSLFSGLAFAGLIYTIFLQSKELSFQREELEQTREELKGQKVQLEKQNENIKKQNFEITFFNMLQNLQSIVNNMVDIHGKQKGRNYLHELFDEFHIGTINHQSFKSLNLVVEEKNIEKLKNVIISLYEKKFVIHSYNLGHYYRTIHNIMKLIENEYTELEIRLKYASILQAQLSNDELGFIFYNSLSAFSLNKEKKPEFRRMLDELNILENIDEKSVLNKLLINYFPNTNFYFSRNQVV